jgi:hypothetical protein
MGKICWHVLFESFLEMLSFLVIWFEESGDNVLGDKVI